MTFNKAIMAFPPAFRKTLPNNPQKHPDALLPPQLWRMVFSKLQDPKDLKACSETCITFKSLLDKTKQYWSFELLLPIILPKLDFHSALNCRLVCNDWQGALDRWAVDSPLNVPYQLERDYNTHLETDQLYQSLDLRDQKNLQALLAKKQVLKDCRIIGGAVSIGPEGVPQAGYWNDAWTCLRDHGSKIKSLELHNPGSDEEYSHDILYLSILMTLRQCPNLRKLELEDDISKYSATEDEDDDIGTDMVRESYPLPDLVHLEYLRLVSGVPISIQTTLLERYAPRLKWLGCALYPDMAANLIPTMVNLSQLQLGIPAVEDAEEDAIANDANLRNLLLLPPQHLRTLSFNLGDKVNLELGTLLQICSHFLNLTTLGVSGSVTMQLVGELPADARKFRSVKCILFDDLEGVRSFDFLTCFPSLEQLYLYGLYPVTQAMWRYDRRGTKNIPRPHYGVRNGVRETVRIREFPYPEDEEDYVRMYESNLWVICPRLKSFRFLYHWTKPWKGAEEGSGLKPNTFRRYTREELWRLYGF